jgi:DNA-binding MarR family transcriptional regulator
MTNKTVIRKKNEVGKFTTVHHSILLDTRLSSTAFRLLTMILSDSDTEFNLSQTLYCKRLGISKPTFFSAIDNLEKNGYLRKTEINSEKSTKILYRYTISEFGNLITKEKNEKVTGKPIGQKKGIQESIQIKKEERVKETLVSDEVAQESPQLQPQLENENDLQDYLLSITKLLDFNEVFDAINAMVTNDYSLKEIKLWVKKYLIIIYKEKLYSITNDEEHPKAFKEFKNWHKNEIFENYNLEVNALSKWAKLSKIKHGRKPTTDYETKIGDFYENPKD